MSVDFGVREFGSMKPKLREELRFRFQQIGDRECYLIEDPFTSRFFRIGVPEYVFISLLDGNTTVNEALALTADSLGRDAFTEGDAVSICHWLLNSDLAYTAESARTSRLLSAAQEHAKRKLLVQLNPFFLKLPLFNPDRFFSAALPWTRWLVSWPLFGFWLAVVLCGGYQLASQPDRFVHASAGILASGNWLALGVTWLLLKVGHEFFHGLACKRYGGSVLESGVILILFAPVAYVDVTSSWRVASKWQRIFVSAAGMYFEVFCAAVAALIWSNTGSGPWNHLAYNTILMAGLSTLLINSNPLMRFDGYYILADLLDLPNLYGRGHEQLMYIGRRYLLGLKVRAPRRTAGKNLIIQVYGVLSALWRLIVVATMLIAAQALFHGAGILLALAGIVLWFGVPAIRFAKFLVFGNKLEKPKTARFLCIATAGIGSLSLFMFSTPWPGSLCAPGIVENATVVRIRAETDGFVSEMLARDNAPVKAGQILAQLRNAELETEVAELEVDIRESAFREHRYRQRGTLSAAQIEQRRREALQTLYTDKRRLVEQLTIRAARDGIVIGRQLDSLPGHFVPAGTELFTIVEDATKKVSISIRQQDAEQFAQRTGSTVEVHTCCGRVTGRLQHVSPKASHEVTHAALAAAAGGPVAVRPIAYDDRNERDTRDAWEFAAPRLEGTVLFVESLPAGVQAGQRVTARFRTRHETIAVHLHGLLHDWFRDLARHARLEGGA
jgi:putative peptide zinc metalloprotease protein